MKTAAEKAKDWGCSPSTVKCYCAAGTIPPAEKVGKIGKWMIPDDWPKPPLTRHGLCYLLDTICQLKEGVAYDEIRWGYPLEKVVSGYEYLMSAAFVSTFNIDCLKDELPKANVTPRGLALIERENSEGKSKMKFTAGAKAKVSVGVASVEINGELTNAK